MEINEKCNIELSRFFLCRFHHLMDLLIEIFKHKTIRITQEVEKIAPVRNSLIRYWLASIDRRQKNH